MIASKPSEITAHEEEEEPKRIPIIWLPATLTVGLAVAALYLAGRIFAAHPHHNPPSPAPPEHVAAAPVPVSVPPAPQAPTLIATPTATPTDVKPDAPDAAAATPSQPAAKVGDDTFIDPETGRRYIQVGALTPEASRRFVEHLRAENFDPHVAPGPVPELKRVLIGPFDNLSDLNKTKAQLEAKGIPTFVRQY